METYNQPPAAVLTRPQTLQPTSAEGGGSLISPDPAFRNDSERLRRDRKWRHSATPAPAAYRCGSLLVYLETASFTGWLLEWDHDGKEVFQGEAAQKERSGGGGGPRGAGPGPRRRQQWQWKHQRLRERERLRERHLLWEHDREWKCPRRRERRQLLGRQQRGARWASEAEKHWLIFQRRRLSAAGACASFSPPLEAAAFSEGGRRAGCDYGVRSLASLLLALRSYRIRWWSARS